jgi:hypothetical protein
MTGYCENCAKEQICRKDIGIIWGFCNTDFEQKKIAKADGEYEIERRKHESRARDF